MPRGGPNQAAVTAPAHPERTVYPTPAARRVPLTAADRRAIDALLDRFVPAALARRNPGDAFALSTPALQNGSTRSDWQRGAVPVYPFSPRETTFHYWTLDASYGDQASLDLLLQPRRGAATGAIAFTFRLRRLGGRWLVDSVAPAAIFAPQGKPANIKAGPDFSAPPLRAGGATHRLGALWLAVPLGLVGALALVPIGVLLLGWLREERPFRRERRELPPLPRRAGQPRA